MPLLKLRNKTHQNQTLYPQWSRHCGHSRFPPKKGEYTSTEWTEMEKIWSHHLDQVQKPFTLRPYVEGLILLPEYGFGVQVRFWNVLGTQNRPTCRSASNYCVLHLNLIKGIFKFEFYTHTHQHESNNQHSINHPQTPTYTYHGNPYQTQHASIMHAYYIISSNAANKYHKG